MRPDIFFAARRAATIPAPVHRREVVNATISAMGIVQTAHQRFPEKYLPFFDASVEHATIRAMEVAMRKTGLFLYPGFQVMSFVALSAFEVANKRAGETLYDLHILSEKGGLVRSSLGMEITTEAIGKNDYDTVLIGVGMEPPAPSPAATSYLRRAAKSTRRLASICLGSFALGEAGLLDGRRATTHWRYAGRLREQFPKSKVDMDKIFIADGQIWTSAGMSAGADLAVGMIESDHGADLARLVARGLVMHHRRAGGQSQHSALLDLDTNTDRIQTALTYAKRNLRMPLEIEDLARAACLSPRQFTRVFRSETGTSPAKAIETLRLESARYLLEQSRLPVEDIAKQAGFGNRERMRRAFARTYGEAPRSIRTNAGPRATI
jgi:transcriptional regulator GlxA family with amidase domain